MDTQALLDKKTKEHLSAKHDKNTLTEQLQQLRDHDEILRNLVEDRERTADEALAKLIAYENMGEGNTSSKSSTDLENLINQRLDKIEESIDQLITNKLTESSKQVEQIEAKIDGVIGNNKSFAESITDNLTVNSITSAIKTNKNHEIIQEKEREKRSTHIIIYGVSEASDNSPKEHDDNFVTSFLNTIGVVVVRPRQIIRLGKPNEKKKRPLKLVMNSDADKDTIMSRLCNLKDAEEVYRTVSVRDDYTIEERQLIREWLTKAEEKNKEENTQAWRVRGTPKNGLRLVKITKQR